MTVTDGVLPGDAYGNKAAGGYSPNVGVLPLQQGTPSSDGQNQPSAPLVIAGSSGASIASKAVNTPPTLSDIPLVTALSPANSGLPVNVPAIVQKANGKSTGSVATLAQAFTNANVAGNTIVVVAGCGNGTAMTVADSNSNTYVQAITAPNSTTFETAIFYAVNVAGGPNTVTVTNAGATASMAVQLYEVSGLLAQVGGCVGQTSLGTGTGTTATTSYISSATPNALAFMGVAVGTTAEAVTATSGSNWTVDSSQNTTTPSGLFSLGALSQSLSSVAPVLPTADIAASKPWAAAVAIFKPVVLGIAGNVHIAGYNYTNIATQTTTLVKTGPGVLHSIVINKGTANGTIKIDDALTDTTPVIGTITLPATLGVPVSTIYDVTFATGLTIVTGGATTDITVVWR